MRSRRNPNAPRNIRMHPSEKNKEQEVSQLIANLVSRGRAVVVALVLGATAVTALPAPVVAQEPSATFRLELPGGSVEFNTNGQRRVQPDNNRNKDYFWDDNWDRYCLSDRIIRRALRERGWRDIDFVRELRRNRVEIVARYSRSYYLLRADRCEGEVRIIERLRRNRGFGLQFNF